MREEIIRKIEEKKIIAIVRGVYGDDCLNLARALNRGGIELMEVTFDQSHHEDWIRTSETIAYLRAQMGDKMAIGAGTVTSLETLKLAADGGAQFIVSPDTNEDVIRATVAGGMVSLPGAMTPTEVLTAHKYGADFVKLFPASCLGVSYIKAIRAPISHIRLLATGGINETNTADYLQAGSAGVGVGGNLVNKKWIAAGEFDKITALAREFVKAAEEK